MLTVTVQGLTVTYRVPVRGEGLWAAIVSVFRREYREVRAVRGVSFDVEAGEVVGFIGPNGAGKTTTLKVLSGILHPTAGEVSVLGFRPERRERRFLRQIAMIRGSQPIGGPTELTVMDALRFQQLLYQVPKGEFERNLGELAELLDLGPLLERRLRALSLGERMRAGLAHSLVYRPKVLFLDEPTLGLDVSGVAMMRRFIADYSRDTGATVLLTSHYMADVESLCRRVLLIDRGALRHDGDLRELSRALSPFKVVRVSVPGAGNRDWLAYGSVVEADGDRVGLRVPRHEVPAVTARLLAELPVTDLSVEDPSLEDVMDRLYRKASV